MNSQVISIALTAFLGGSLIQAILGFVRDRSKDRTDYGLASFASLQEYNAYLLKRIREVELDLDAERAKRRTAEQRISDLETRMTQAESRTDLPYDHG